MPTNHDETIAQRYQREGREHLDMLAMLTPEQIRDLELQAHNALCDVDRLNAELAALKAGRGEAVAPYGYLREVDGNVQLSIGALRPADRSGGIATPWAAIFAEPPATADAVSVPMEIALRMAADAAQYDHEHAVVNDNVQLWQQPNARVSLTVGDLRTVRALLAQSQEVKS